MAKRCLFKGIMVSILKGNNILQLLSLSPWYFIIMTSIKVNPMFRGKAYVFFSQLNDQSTLKILESKQKFIYCSAIKDTPEYAKLK